DVYVHPERHAGGRVEGGRPKPPVSGRRITVGQGGRHVSSVRHRRREAGAQRGPDEARAHSRTPSRRHDWITHMADPITAVTELVAQTVSIAGNGGGVIEAYLARPGGNGA